MTLRDMLREALKAKIKHDVGDNRFDPSKWHTTQLGTHYETIGDPDVRIAVINNVLKDTFTTVLSTVGITFTSQEWALFSDGISLKSNPTTATTRLLQVVSISS